MGVWLGFRRCLEDNQLVWSVMVEVFVYGFLGFGFTMFYLF
jgi:hypothetical protein